jgi:hypothetical protein
MHPRARRDCSSRTRSIYCRKSITCILSWTAGSVNMEHMRSSWRQTETLLALYDNLVGRKRGRRSVRSALVSMGRSCQPWPRLMTQIPIRYLRSAKNALLAQSAGIYIQHTPTLDMGWFSFLCSWSPFFSCKVYLFYQALGWYGGRQTASIRTKVSMYVQLLSVQLSSHAL